jgi:hypothetical protein
VHPPASCKQVAPYDIICEAWKLLYRPFGEVTVVTATCSGASTARRRASIRSVNTLYVVVDDVSDRPDPSIEGALLISAEVAKRYGRIGSWITHFQKKLPTGVKEDG